MWSICMGSVMKAMMGFPLSLSKSVVEAIVVPVACPEGAHSVG
jgi:hypothetical protein